MHKSSNVLGKITMASVSIGGSVFLLSQVTGLFSWQNPKAANRFFKRLYGKIYRADSPGWKNFHMLADFRLHGVSNQSLQDDTFERAIMKNSADQEVARAATDYPIQQIDVEGVLMYGVLCEGKQAESWHKAGIRAELPKPGKVIR